MDEDAGAPCGAAFRERVLGDDGPGESGDGPGGGYHLGVEGGERAEVVCVGESVVVGD